MILRLPLITTVQKLFDTKINYGFNNRKLSLNRQRTQWRCNKFQSTNIFVASWATIVVHVILAKVYLCGFDRFNTLHTPTLCMFYFITDGYQNSIFSNIASIPSWDYEKSHRLKQRLLIGQPSLQTAVSQACPSGRILGWYGRRSVATKGRILMSHKNRCNMQGRLYSLLASQYNPIVNPAMMSTVRFYDRNELYGSPDVRNCRMPNFLGWASFVISLISIN